MKTLILAGGGTGGHILAGVAIADAWRAKHGPDARVIFVGAHGGIEEKLVPRSGYPLVLLTLGSLNRVSLARKMKTVAVIPLALMKSCAILLREKPSVVFGVGGYASGPVVLMARVLGWIGLCPAKTAILEQNSVAGMTNRLLGRVAQKVYSAFPIDPSQFPGKRIVISGNPVRAEIKPLPPSSRDPFTIFIFGGSQGAVGMNTLVIEALAHLGDLRDRIRFIHQTGEKDFERVAEAHRRAGTQARVEKFVYDMPSAYREASLLICRSGSSTLAEIAAVGRAVVLVPLPTASDNHQEKNARTFSDAGAAFLVLQSKSKGEDLARIIREAYESPSRIAEMEKKASAFYKPRAAQDIIEDLHA